MSLLCAALAVAMLVLVAATVISWFPLERGTTLWGLGQALQRTTDPVLGRLRRVVPPVRVAGLALDLTPLVVIAVLLVVQWAIC